MTRTLQIGLEWFPEIRGGLNRVYYDCTRYLPEAGINFCGLVAGSPNVELNSNGLVQTFAPSEDSLFQRYLTLRKSVARLLAENDCDLIVSHFALYTFPVIDLFGERPLVIHFQGPWAGESKIEGENLFGVKIKKALEQITYRRASKFIVLCQDFRELLHQKYQVPLDKIHIIPPGIDIEQFNINLSSTEARHKLNWHPDRPIIFCIRRLAKRMGLENLITAMATVRDQYPHILLYIAGKGALKDTLQSQIEALGLTDNVKLLGYVSDEQLPLCYRAANFSVVPTIALEGFGLIVIESLAAGTPVLGTPIGGIPEILKPFCEDLVFAGCNPDQLATGIIETLSGDRILPSNQACLEYVKANYNWKAIAQKIKLVYQSALSDCLTHL